jgi:predicted DNA-binding transcriptional regulator AlpA
MDGELEISDSRHAEPIGAGRAKVSTARGQSISFDLGRLTPGERLWLWRRSGVSGAQTRRGVAVDGRNSNSTAIVARSQLEAAVEVGLDASAYWAAENDMSPAERVLEILARLKEPAYELADACRLARRRSPLTLPEVAVAIGVGSRPTFYKLEAAGDRRVVKFWRDRGFRFPRKLPLYFSTEGR